MHIQSIVCATVDSLCLEYFFIAISKELHVNFLIFKVCNKSCMNFDLHKFFQVPKNLHLKALLYLSKTSIS